MEAVFVGDDHLLRKFWMMWLPWSVMKDSG